MPAPVLVVHDEQETRELAVTTLRAAFLGVVGFEDPMAALDAIETDSPRPGLGHVWGKPHGVALARMVRIKRPGTRVVFVAPAGYEPHSAFYCRCRSIPIF
jgi:DNA-binding NtrC family response regulator